MFDNLSTEQIIMYAIGFAGQAMFSMRFLVQWLTSEKNRKSMIPLAFWYFSLAGGATLFVYAAWQRDPVIMLGQGLGLFIYLRNLWLIYRERREQAAGVQAS